MGPAAAERFGVHWLHEVVKQEEEEAPQHHQAHHGHEDEAANDEGVHDLWGRKNEIS